jgi:hypothetical protein
LVPGLLNRQLPLPHQLQFPCSITFIHGTEFVAPTPHSISTDRFEFHSNFETFLKPTIWASLPLRFVNVTISFSYASVNFFILDGSFEESFTGLASE